MLTEYVRPSVLAIIVPLMSVPYTLALITLRAVMVSVCGCPYLLSTTAIYMATFGLVILKKSADEAVLEP